jgi:hypothetical protein
LSSSRMSRWADSMSSGSGVLGSMVVMPSIRTKAVDVTVNLQSNMRN